MMKRFEEFKRAYDDAIATINFYLEPGSHEPQMNSLVKWMLETDANPYSFLPEQWGGALGTAEGFAGLLKFIDHALYDDGDITFVSIDGQPQIVFDHRFEDGFRERVLGEQRAQMEKKYGIEYAVNVLDITPDEFVELYEAWHTDWVKSCFMRDAKRANVEWTAEHYRKYQCWDESWVDEAKRSIDR